MEENLNRVKSKRLKFIRALMYIDVLVLLLTVMMIDIRTFSMSTHGGVCMRILVLLVVFALLFAGEKSLSRYLRKHRDDVC